jgi:DNA-binding MarR family transcriptional regulator
LTKIKQVIDFCTYLCVKKPKRPFFKNMERTERAIHAHTQRPALNALIQVSMAAAYVNQCVDEAIKPLKITNVQYNILRVLSRAGQDGLSRSNILVHLTEKSVDLTRSVDGLVRLNFARRDRPENDRRIVLHYITPEGLDALAHVNPLFMQMLEGIEGKMSENEWQIFAELCMKLAATP